MPKQNDPAWKKLEQDVADILGGQPQPGSGNQPLVKLDVRGRELLFSCKHAQGDSVTITPYSFDEAERAIHGPGGIGGDTIAAFATQTKRGDIVISMKVEDWTDLFGREDLAPLPSDKADQRRRAASRSPLMRDDA